MPSLSELQACTGSILSIRTPEDLHTTCTKKKSRRCQSFRQPRRVLLSVFSAPTCANAHAWARPSGFASRVTGMLCTNCVPMWWHEALVGFPWPQVNVFQFGGAMFDATQVSFRDVPGNVRFTVIAVNKNKIRHCKTRCSAYFYPIQGCVIDMVDDVNPELINPGWSTMVVPPSSNKYATEMVLPNETTVRGLLIRGWHYCKGGLHMPTICAQPDCPLGLEFCHGHQYSHHGQT